MVIVLLEWEYEDELPSMTNSKYNAIFDQSKVIDGVRMFPFITVDERRIYIASKKVE